MEHFARSCQLQEVLYKSEIWIGELPHSQDAKQTFPLLQINACELSVLRENSCRLSLIRITVREGSNSTWRQTAEKSIRAS